MFFSGYVRSGASGILLYIAFDMLLYVYFVLLFSSSTCRYCPSQSSVGFAASSFAKEPYRLRAGRRNVSIFTA
jgi:hypothetical protein